jgi:F-box and WD-40 domain protein 1/11
MSILHGLPTSRVYDIVNAVGPLLHVNFINKLPPEVCLKVLEYLDPVSLIQIARASRASMSLSMDWTLWQQLYYMEGWLTNASELQKFEKELGQGSTSSRSRPVREDNDEHMHKKRATPKLMSAAFMNDGDSEMEDVGARSPIKQQSLFGGPISQEQSRQSDPILKENLGFLQKSLGQPDESPEREQSEISQRESYWPTKSSPSSDLSMMSSLIVRDRRDPDTRKLNWQYLYTQRRRLEANWEAEKYVNFQLPHPGYPEEAHEECIYAIQHSGKYLVSGSRDRTLRIWDLDTRRLVRKPLEGHTGSVLCLQFDADPEEDLIVSGSSDSTVMLWRFSTGKLLQVLKKAHRESVLNVRFDHRILVTCSKDKTIKIFNRQPLHPGELGYPDMPSVVKVVPTVLNNYGFSPSPYAGLPVKPPYTMIGCLEGHGAAVNAVQIYKHEIVSASGDRNVKVWDWPLQTCTRTLVGHQKGIACVQYDGRRIVSGSSDNEVKVFDKETGLEVASLRAHTNLVRTVQAGFGDLPHSAEEDHVTARNIDQEYFRAVDAGDVPRAAPKTSTRNAGSSKPEDIMAYGAKLPPGGGGGRYGRIVSGSYDETVIIWRRDKEGIWKAQHTLRQADAARAAALEYQNSTTNQAATPGSQAFYINVINTAVDQGPNALRLAIHQHPQILTYQHLHNAIVLQPNQNTRNHLRHIVAQSVARQQALLLQGHQGGQNPMQDIQPAQATASLATPQPNTNPNANLNPNPTVQTQQPQQPPQAQTQPQIHATHTVLPHAIQMPPLQTHLQTPASMARVFKLQFDARRIICCSQTTAIVGWDFANGDEKIIEASRFFDPVQ